jgi:hypothetical protein
MVLYKCMASKEGVHISSEWRGLRLGRLCMEYMHLSGVESFHKYVCLPL